MQGESGQTLLLLRVDGQRRLQDIRGFARAHLDEDDTLALKRDNVDFAEIAGKVVFKNAVPQPTQKGSGRAFRAIAEPASPPRMRCDGEHGERREPRAGWNAGMMQWASIWGPLPHSQ